MGRSPPRAPHWAMRRRCRGRHQRDARRIRLSEDPRQSHPFAGPSRKCQGRAARRRGQCPKPRPFLVRAGGAKRRGIDGAEHSAILFDVMARGPSHSATHFHRTSRPCSEPATGTWLDLVTGPSFSPRTGGPRTASALQQRGRRERPFTTRQRRSRNVTGVVHAFLAVGEYPDAPPGGGRERRPHAMCHPARKSLCAERLLADGSQARAISRHSRSDREWG